MNVYQASSPKKVEILYSCFFHKNLQHTLFSIHNEKNGNHYPFSTTSLSVSILKFHLSNTSPEALLMITRTTLCSFPVSNHSTWTQSYRKQSFLYLHMIWTNQQLQQNSKNYQRVGLLSWKRRSWHLHLQ